jgi:polysaccharide export outer membrane protein
MNLKFVNISYIGILILIVFALLGGCSTGGTTSKSDEVSPLSDEVQGEVKITEFILGPGDRVEIMVYRHDDLKRTVQIDTSGMIGYPLVGDIQANGLSIFQLRDRIRDRLAEYIVDPQVSVGVTAVQSQKVYVIGEVTRPGVFSLDKPLSAIEAISQAGGFTLDANDESVMVIRGNRDKPQLIKLDLESALKKGNIAQNIQLRRGDIVYVPSTLIADVSRFSVYLKNILYPILMIEQGIILGPSVIDVLQSEGGKVGGTTITIERP